MAKAKKRDPKSAALAQDGVLNPNPGAVRDVLFTGNPFFDAKDLVQVRYEMVRRHQVRRPCNQRSGRGVRRHPPDLLQSPERIAGWWARRSPWSCGQRCRVVASSSARIPTWFPSARAANQSRQQEIGQGLHHSLRVSLHGCLRISTLQLEDELRPIVASVFAHGLPPSFSREGILRRASDSHRSTREHWQAR